MIIGHIGVAYAAKARWPRLPLGAVIAASFAPDVLREVFASAALDWRLTNLYSHGLPWCLLLAAAAGLVARKALADRGGAAAWVIAGLVVVHVMCDLVSGSKDMGPGGPVGLDTESFQQLELVLEGGLMVVGWLLLRRAIPPRRATHWAVPAFLIFLEATYLAGSMSQRPYRTRCIASPMAECTNESLLTTKWRTRPFWWSGIR